MDRKFGGDELTLAPHNLKKPTDHFKVRVGFYGMT